MNVGHQATGVGMKGTLQEGRKQKNDVATSRRRIMQRRNASCSGAILVNNETFYRVSDFLEPHHFFVPSHQDIYEKIGQSHPRGQNRVSDHAEDLLSGRCENRRPVRNAVPSAPCRLTPPRSSTPRITAARSTTLRLRRNLIRIGEDMVNIAFDAPIDVPPGQQIDDAERQTVRTGRNGTQRRRGFVSVSAMLLTETIEMAHAAYNREGALSGISTGLHASWTG